MVTLGLSTTRMPAPPSNVGVLLPVGELSGVMDTSGDAVTTVKVIVSLLPPSSRPCSATAVYSPGSRAGVTVTSQLSEARGNPVVAVRTGEPLALAPA